MIHVNSQMKNHPVNIATMELDLRIGKKIDKYPINATTMAALANHIDAQ